MGHRSYYILNNGKIWVFTSKIAAAYAAVAAAAAVVVVVVSFFYVAINMHNNGNHNAIENYSEWLDVEKGELIKIIRKTILRF